MCYLIVYVINIMFMLSTYDDQVSGHQWAISKYIWGKSKLIHRLLAAKVFSTPNPFAVQGSTIIIKKKMGSLISKQSNLPSFNTRSYFISKTCSAGSCEYLQKGHNLTKDNSELQRPLGGHSNWTRSFT